MSTTGESCMASARGVVASRGSRSLGGIREL
jgi:hypothetical protein